MIQHITKLTFAHKKIELTPGHKHQAHYRERISNPNKFNTLFLLEPGTDHVHEMYWDWDTFFEAAEHYAYRMDYDFCFTQDYIEAFGKNPVPQKPGYGFNHVVHLYAKGGWYSTTVKLASASHIVDGWAKGVANYTKRLSAKGYYYSTYKRERIYTRLHDWYPGFEARCAELGLEICDW